MPNINAKTLTVRLWIIWGEYRRFCDLVADVFVSDESVDLEHTKQASETVLKMMQNLADNIYSEPGDVVDVHARLLVEVGADMLESDCIFSVMCTETGNYMDDITIDRNLSKEVKSAFRVAMLAGQS
jgi:hypothetical protein